MFLVQERLVLRRPRLIRNLPVDGVYDRAADHRALAADGNVLGAVSLGILDAVRDDVACLRPRARDVWLTVSRLRRLPVRILLRRVPRIDPARWGWILRRGRRTLRGDAHSAGSEHRSRNDRRDNDSEPRSRHTAS